MSYPAADEQPSEVLLIAGLMDDNDGSWRADASKLFRIHYVPDCEQALGFARRHLPAVVMCGERLADGDWTYVLAEMASLTDPPAVIVTSRLADERLWAEVLNLGGYDLLSWPLDRNEVRRVLELAHLHRITRGRFIDSRHAAALRCGGAWA